MESETATELGRDSRVPGGAEANRRVEAVDAIGLRLLACVALSIALICLLILPSGPHESDESLSWVLAFLVGLPGGFGLAAYQERRLAGAAPAAVARGVAAGIVALVLSLMLRRVGSGERLEHAIVLLGSLAALLAPFAAARLWRKPGDGDPVAARMISALWLAALALIFVPSHALRLSNLLPALALATVLLLGLYLLPSLRVRGPMGWAADVALCVLVVFCVVQLPNLSPYVPDLVYHQGFFLGPANDVLHGRAMLGGAWSQYGIGLIDALALLYKVIPIGFGTMMLIVLALTAAEYVCVYAVMRLAGVGQVLAMLTLAAAAAGNLFSPLNVYLIYPSAGPVRFGLPYLIVLAAVLGARVPAWRRWTQTAIVACVALGAVWSFETFVYCGATYGCVVLVEALTGGRGSWRRVARAALVGLAAAAAALLLFSLLTLAFDGRLEWGPYLEYIQLYSTGEFGTLPVEIFSAGPIMGATIFLSAVLLVWLAAARPGALPAPLRNALAGFTGVALSTFTYYLGRSHPNNLLVLMVPAIALTGLWAHVLLRSRPTPWRTAGVAAIVLGWSVIAVASWPSVQLKWHDTALARAFSGSLRSQIEGYGANPPFNPLAPTGVEMLEKHLPPGEPALVITEPDLTTEVLMRSGRRNLLPISHAPEDVLIESSYPRVRRSAEDVPPGTLLLTSPVPEPPGGLSATGLPIDFNILQELALEVLHRRFAFHRIEGSPETLELVRLVPKGGAEAEAVSPPG